MNPYVKKVKILDNYCLKLIVVIIKTLRLTSNQVE